MPGAGGAGGAAAHPSAGLLLAGVSGVGSGVLAASMQSGPSWEGGGSLAEGRTRRQIVAHLPHAAPLRRGHLSGPAAPDAAFDLQPSAIPTPPQVQRTARKGHSQRFERRSRVNARAIKPGLASAPCSYRSLPCSGEPCNGPVRRLVCGCTPLANKLRHRPQPFGLPTPLRGEAHVRQAWHWP